MKRKEKKNSMGEKLVKETPFIFQTIFMVIDFSSKFCCTNGSNYGEIRKLRQRGWVTCSCCCYLEPGSWASPCSSPPHPIHTPSRRHLWMFPWTHSRAQSWSGAKVLPSGASHQPVVRLHLCLTSLNTSKLNVAFDPLATRCRFDSSGKLFLEAKQLWL